MSRQTTGPLPVDDELDAASDELDAAAPPVPPVPPPPEEDALASAEEVLVDDDVVVPDETLAVVDPSDVEALVDDVLDDDVCAPPTPVDPVTL